jgi:hypothetical protein
MFIETFSFVSLRNESVCNDGHQFHQYQRNEQSACLMEKQYKVTLRSSSMYVAI